MWKFLKSLFKDPDVVGQEPCLIVRERCEALRGTLVTYKSGLRIVRWCGSVYVLNTDNTIIFYSDTANIVLLK